MQINYRGKRRHKEEETNGENKNKPS